MILFELAGGTENHPAYRTLAWENGERHYGFLKSAVDAAIAVNRPFLSQTIIKAINFHAIACLHTSAGVFRPCEVVVGSHQPPQHFRVGDLMDDFVNVVNRRWDEWDAFKLGAYVLWRLNHIHPFINGNGRTARAACYFVLCLKFGGWLQGTPILPELLRQPENKEQYIAALQVADSTIQAAEVDLEMLQRLIANLLVVQMNSDILC